MCPTRSSLFWEVLVGWVSDQVEVGLGRATAMSCRWPSPSSCWSWRRTGWSFFPGLFHNTDYLPSPTADVNLTYALGDRLRLDQRRQRSGPRVSAGTSKSFFAPPRWLAPIRALEELMKPVTLALRLFGNLFSGGIMIALLLGDPDLLFPGAIYCLQCASGSCSTCSSVSSRRSFALLTILYYQFAVAKEGH